MTDQRIVDQHLGAALDRVLAAVYQVKQVAWAATGSPARAALDDFLDFLVERSQALDAAEARIDGRSPDLASPSAHQRGNLVAEAGGDVDRAVDLLADHLEALAADLRARAEVIGDGADAANLVGAVAEGLAGRVARLRAVE